MITLRYAVLMIASSTTVINHIAICYGLFYESLSSYRLCSAEWFVNDQLGKFARMWTWSKRDIPTVTLRD
jgi:hypothetical protein